MKVLLILVPRLVTIVMQATRINASMTAYSTAVGPSSLTRKSFRFFRHPDIGSAPVVYKAMMDNLSGLRAVNYRAKACLEARILEKYATIFDPSKMDSR